MSFFRSLFHPTADDNKIPTDTLLDQDIELLQWHLRVIKPLKKKIVRKKLGLIAKHKKYLALHWIVYPTIVIACIIITWKKIVEPLVVRTPPQIINTEIYISNLRPYAEFLYEVGKKESGNDWGENSTTMLGRFQFDPNTLKSIGINVEAHYFLKDTLLQLAAFKRLMHLNRQAFQKYIDRWNGKTLPQDKRYVITESGILMAFHLKPSGAVLYFNSGCIDDSDTDGNGTPVSYYVKKFSGYRVE